MKREQIPLRSLFRPEVLQARTDRTHGPILLVRSPSSWMLASGGALIAALLLAYLWFGTYTKRTTTTGLLLPASGAIHIQPPTPGVVSERYVKEGQQVRQGDVLFVLSDERRIVDGDDNHRLSDLHTVFLTRRRESLLRAREKTQLLELQTERGIRNRLKSMHEELDRNEQEIALQTRRIAASAKMYERHRALAKSHFISELALQEKGDQVAALRVQLLAAQRLHAELTRNISAAEDEMRQAPVRSGTQLAELDRDLAALSQEVADIQMRDRYAITAPMSGMITAITAEVGQSAGTQPLAVLLPEDAELVANLFSPSRAVGFVEKGQKVRLRYQAYPYQKFGQYMGTVTEVSRNPIQPGELPGALPLAVQEGVYRITVRLDKQHISAYGKSISLLPGMVVDADIEQDRRRLIEWVLEPLYGLGKYIA